MPGGQCRGGSIVSGLADSRPVRFAVLIVAVVAGILLLKAAAARMPNGGVVGAVKTAVLSV
jgi:hypothetical protein